MRAVLFVSLLAVAASAQLPTTPESFASYALLRDYLSLSTAQQMAILRNRDAYQQTLAERWRRLTQLRVEIQEETIKDNPDPIQIGTRSVEIELTCRVMDQDAKTWGDRNIEILTDPQKVKLKTLEDAMKLAPTISNAQALGMLGPSTSLGYSGLLLGAPSGGVSGAILPTIGLTPYPTRLSSCATNAIFDPLILPAR